MAEREGNSGEGLVQEDNRRDTDNQPGEAADRHVEPSRQPPTGQLNRQLRKQQENTAGQHDQQEHDFEEEHHENTLVRNHHSATYPAPAPARRTSPPTSM